MKMPEPTEPSTAAERDRAICYSKLTWQSVEQARAAAAYATWQYGHASAHPRPYQCRHCGLWHLARAND